MTILQMAYISFSFGQFYLKNARFQNLGIFLQLWLIVHSTRRKDRVSKMSLRISYQPRRLRAQQAGSSNSRALLLLCVVVENTSSFWALRDLYNALTSFLIMLCLIKKCFAIRFFYFCIIIVRDSFLTR